MQVSFLKNDMCWSYSLWGNFLLGGTLNIFAFTRSGCPYRQLGILLFICRKLQSESKTHYSALLYAVFFSHLEMGNIMTRSSEFPFDFSHCL